MTERTTIGKLDIDPLLAEFVNDLLLPQLTIGKPDFWTGFEAIVDQFTPRNDSLLATRDSMQSQIDEWHSSRSSQAIEPAEYMQFLRAIGYLLEEGDDFSIDTENVDPEIASIAGPQLVVPLKNARFALNAANARWGSLYDALYGTDVIAQEGGAVRSQGYNPIRGRRVIHLAKEFLDRPVRYWGRVTAR